VPLAARGRPPAPIRAMAYAWGGGSGKGKGGWDSGGKGGGKSKGSSSGWGASSGWGDDGWGADDGWGGGGGWDSGSWGGGGKDMMSMMYAMMSKGKGKGKSKGKGDSSWSQSWGQSSYGPAKGSWGGGATAGAQTWGPYMPAFRHVEAASEEELEAFLALHSVEQHAADKLRKLDRKLQKVVIMKGSMADARDPTAVLMQRCSALMTLKEGDWICSGCYDHQFAKNDSCRKCGTAKGDVAVVAEPENPAFEMVDPASAEELEAFLTENSEVQEHAAEKLRSLDPRIQKVIINKGSMTDARDQTAVLMQRCAAMLTLKPGDWICLGCYDHQFSKNDSCRRCGAAKP